jgi:hypothetical protein
MKTYKIVLNSISNVKRHFIVNFETPFDAFLYVLQRTESVRDLIDGFEVKEIHGKIKLTTKEITFLVMNWKQNKITPEKIYAKNHPKWLHKNLQINIDAPKTGFKNCRYDKSVVETGFHENKDYYCWVKLYGDWLLINKKTNELTISDKNKCVAQFEEW